MFRSISEVSHLVVLPSSCDATFGCFCAEIVGDVQLRKYGRFLEDYASQLREIERALQESVGDSWDMTLDPVSLQVSSTDQQTHSFPCSVVTSNTQHFRGIACPVEAFQIGFV